MLVIIQFPGSFRCSFYESLLQILGFCSGRTKVKLTGGKGKGLIPSVISQPAAYPLAPLVHGIRPSISSWMFRACRIHFLLFRESGEYNYDFLLSDSSQMTNNNSLCNPCTCFLLLEIHVEHQIPNYNLFIYLWLQFPLNNSSFTLPSVTPILLDRADGRKIEAE